MNEGWYHDSDGDYMPASAEAWDDLANEAESFYRKVIPGYENMNDNMREVLIQYVEDRLPHVAEHGDNV